VAFRRPGIYKTPEELRRLVEPGLVTAASLDAVTELVMAGVTTAELDAAAERTIRGLGGEPNFMLVPGYRHTVCTSVNEAVVHGVPGPRVLRAGDLVSVDSGAQVDGWNGDSARTFVLDDPDRPEVVVRRRRLSDLTEQSLWRGIAALASARHLHEVGAAISDFLEDEGDPGIVEDYVGHGIGRSMHEEPSVPNYRVRAKGPAVRPGLVVAIEPMVTLGGIDTVTQPDGWTVTTADGSDAAHWEHSVAVHDGGIWVLTAADGGAAGLAPLGVTPVPIS